MEFDLRSYFKIYNLDTLLVIKTILKSCNQMHKGHLLFFYPYNGFVCVSPSFRSETN